MVCFNLSLFVSSEKVSSCNLLIPFILYLQSRVSVICYWRISQAKTWILHFHIIKTFWHYNGAICVFAANLFSTHFYISVKRNVNEYIWHWKAPTLRLPASSKFLISINKINICSVSPFVSMLEVELWNCCLQLCLLPIPACAAIFYNYFSIIHFCLLWSWQEASELCSA